MHKYANIPKELRDKDRWVCAWDDSKVPMRAWERKAASSTSPDTWSCFQTALASVELGNYDHIGYVFADDGYVGIDIDDGFSEGFLTPLAVDIIGKCQSYTERSKSGRGVHIILKGDLPFDGKNNFRGVEIYKAKRYFIMTGRTLFYSRIQENQEAIGYVVGKYFQEEERESRERFGQKIYSAVYKKPVGKKIFISPDYPVIAEGGRNLSLTSLAGSLWAAGYNKKAIYEELVRVNEKCCVPPLGDREVRGVVSSVCRYKR